VLDDVHHSAVLVDERRVDGKARPAAIDPCSLLLVAATRAVIESGEANETHSRRRPVVRARSNPLQGRNFEALHMRHSPQDEASERK